jgi:transcriptional regulator with XRE-family HTH domain
LLSRPQQTPEELEVALGDRLKALRLDRNIDQKTLAERAGISVRALRNLEGGQGSTLRSLVSLLRALGREEWLATIAPVATINPLSLSRQATPRQRATGSRHATSA